MSFGLDVRLKVCGTSSRTLAILFKRGISINLKSLFRLQFYKDILYFDTMIYSW